MIGERRTLIVEGWEREPQGRVYHCGKGDCFMGKERTTDASRLENIVIKTTLLCFSVDPPAGAALLVMHEKALPEKD